MIGITTFIFSLIANWEILLLIILSLVSKNTLIIIITMFFVLLYEKTIAEKRKKQISQDFGEIELLFFYASFIYQRKADKEKELKTIKREFLKNVPIFIDNLKPSRWYFCVTHDVIIKLTVKSGKIEKMKKIYLGKKYLNKEKLHFSGSKSYAQNIHRKRENFYILVAKTKDFA